MTRRDFSGGKDLLSFLDNLIVNHQGSVSMGIMVGTGIYCYQIRWRSKNGKYENIANHPESLEAALLQAKDFYDGEEE